MHTDGILAAVAEPQGSAILIVEGKDLLPADIEVVPVPAGPSDLRVISFSDAILFEILVASETGDQLARLAPEVGGWGVSNTPYDGPARFDIGGNIGELVSVLAILHRAAGLVSLAPFGNGEGASLKPPKWITPTIVDPRRILISGKADVVVSSPTSGLAIHRAEFVENN